MPIVYSKSSNYQAKILNIAPTSPLTITASTTLNFLSTYALGNSSCTSDSSNNVYIVFGTLSGSIYNVFIKLDSTLTYVAMKRLNQPYYSFNPINVQLYSTTSVFFYASGMITSADT